MATSVVQSLRTAYRIGWLPSRWIVELKPSKTPADPSPTGHPGRGMSRTVL